jgi:hypothetical protein
VTPDQLGAVAGFLVGRAVEAWAVGDYYAADRIIIALLALKGDGIFIDGDAPLRQSDQGESSP